MKAAFIVLLSIFAFAQSVYGVKDYLFKNCDNSGFCHRNRHFANQVKNTPTFESKYSIDPNSISVNDYQITANLIKQLPGGLPPIELPLELSVMKGDGIRVKISERRDPKALSSAHANYQRYDETPQWAFTKDVGSFSQKLQNDTKKSSVSVKPEHIEVHVDEAYSVKFQFAPFKISLFKNNEVQCVINDQNFLNIEHWRSKGENKKHVADEESDFDMFSDSFKDSSADSIPLGPESIGLDFTFPGFKHVYGVPEHADSLNLKDTTTSNYPYRLYNVDIFEYETDSRFPMYGSIPFMLASKPDVSIGLFWVNSADTFIDIDKTTDPSSSRTHWISENGALEFIVWIGSTPAEINEKYGLVTGYTHLPLLASLGYHQCRWNYNDEKDVLSINELMDIHQIPYDYIWLDIEYAESKKYFTWNKENFPDPERMLKALDHTGRNLVIIIDPHIKTGYFISNELLQKKLTINTFEEKPYYGHCWPGESIWIDTMNPKALDFWDSKFVFSKSNEFMGKLSTNLQIWNDMNEPSVFDGPETTSPRDNLHYGLWEHRSIHNVFGLTVHEATYRSMTKRLQDTPAQRPFVLTRSYFAGSQRTAAMWTGDNMSKWEYLKISIPMILTSGISGMPFAGADVGGFFGNPSKELLTRWYQTGIWYPFFRAHAHIDSRRREPWVPGEPFTSIIRDSIQLRYALLPMLYTSFHTSSINGTPVIKPLFYESPGFTKNYEIEDQFFLGDTGVLVKPVTDEGADEIDILIPDQEIYYEFDNGNIQSGDIVHYSEGPQYITKSVNLETIPMLLKGGSIIAMKRRSRRSSKLMKHDPYTLVVALDRNGDASGKLYIDDGESFDYLNGDSISIEFAVDQKSKTIRSTTTTGNTADGNLASELSGVRIEDIIILSPNKFLNQDKVLVKQNGKQWAVSCDSEESKATNIRNPKLSVTSDWTIYYGDDIEEDEGKIHDEL